MTALTTSPAALATPDELDLTEHVVLLLGVVGSTAYGMAHAGSDIDRLGVFLAPSRGVLGLHSHAIVNTTHVTKAPQPDSALHELGKYCHVALKGNPTLLELLWLPTYERTTPAGDALVALRSAFLSEKAVRGAYGGYAYQQANRLQRRAREGAEGFGTVTPGRTLKHGRHCLRLLRQGRHLLATGELMLDVSSIRDELFAAGELASKDPDAFHDLFERELAVLEATPSVLPEHPDADRIGEFLIETRMSTLLT